MTVYGKLTVVVSDDSRYEKGNVYDFVVDDKSTPDPAAVIVAEVPADAPPAA